MDTAGAVESQSWFRRHRRWVVVASAVVVVALGVVAALSWHFSSAALVPDHSDWPADVTVEGVAEDRVVLSRSEDTLRRGVYGLSWQGGHAIVGNVMRSDGDRVTRRLRDVQGYLAPGMEVAFERPYVGDPRQALGAPFLDVRVPGDLGPMPAWLVPGRSRTWAIVVHGINDTPEGGLMVVPTLRRAGLPSLLITYREDPGAPSSPDGLHHMGLTEWRDLQAAARYAFAHGARSLVLVGYSMGGAITSQFMQRSPLAERVSALVLDAPALSWEEIFDFNATEMGMPAFSTAPLKWAIGARIDVDWDSLDALRHPEAFQLPILLFHGTDDELVPISTSDAFAEELAGRVEYFRVPGADHTQSWNVDPALYERRLMAFLNGIGARQRTRAAHEGGH